MTDHLTWRLSDGPPPREFTTDGCSCLLCRFLIPNDMWVFVYQACVDHDRAYWAGGDSLDRLFADIALMTAIAKAGLVWQSVAFFFGVRIGGVRWMPFPWHWGYGYPHKGDLIMEKLKALLAALGSRGMSALASIIGGGIGLYWTEFAVRALCVAAIAVGVTWLFRWYTERKAATQSDE